MATTQSVTFWNRLEPRPRSKNLAPTLAAQVRDPAWLLCRQWQTGEFAGRDTGSPAFVTVTTTVARMNKWSAGGRTVTIDPASPLEKQTLAEPFSAQDLSLSVEIGQVFRSLLAANGLDPVAVYALFLGKFPLTTPAESSFNPTDAETASFLTVCAQQTLDGAAVYALAKQVRDGTPLPSWIPSGLAAGIRGTFTALIAWVLSVWGDLGDVDPPSWSPGRLGHALQVQAQAPDGTGIVLDARPDVVGDMPWSSFDVSPTTISPPAGTPQTIRTTLVPGHVRFKSMPAPRFWDFENGALALPDVKPEARDIAKVLALDFMLIHGTDWFELALPQAIGTLTRVDALVVTDVFGIQTSIRRADAATTAPGPTRWTMFSPTRPTSVGDFFVVPPTSGGAIRGERPIESVRFVRDDMACMAWAIEATLTSPIGRSRPGAERDAAMDAKHPVVPPPSTDTTSPLRYQVETKVPIHWVPLLGNENPASNLKIAAMVRYNPSASPPAYQPVPTTAKILRPGGTSTGYLIADDEIPREGLLIERVICRSRWVDGSTHLWIGRRRRLIAGESASDLRFDVASSTTT